MGVVNVIGIDGMPYTLIQDFIKKGIMKNFGDIIKQGFLNKIHSVIPVISSVAWTSYSTGTEPSGHGIYGFVDRETNPFELTIPLSTERKKESIWNILSKKGKRSAVINVPVTYPVEEINGVMISCFMCTDIEKASYPTTYTQLLKDKDYIIDADATLVGYSKREYLNQIHEALDRRFEVASIIKKSEKWDYYHLHVMETDRLMHFFWNDITDDTSEFHESVIQFFRRLDELLGEFVKLIPKEEAIIFLSDHGFCGIKYEVQINRWLMDKGYLKLLVSGDLSSYKKESLCYSILPGRIYINLENREEAGTVKEEDFDTICKKLKNELLELTCPETGEAIVDHVYFREELYNGKYSAHSADLIIHPKNGYDLKGSLIEEDVFTRSSLTGMHTYENAMYGAVNFKSSNVDNITQLSGNILSEILDIPLTESK